MSQSGQKFILGQQWLTFLCAVQFLTRIPINVDIDYSESRLNQAVGYYPLVGALIGLLVFCVFYGVSIFLPTNVAIIASMGFSLLLTGAFHEDGFADMCDGIGGGNTPQKSLEIMRDSRLGTYGVSGLIMILLFKASLLSAIAEITNATITLAIFFIVSQGLSRASAVAVIASSEYVRSEGTAKPVASGLNPTARYLAIATSAALLIGLCFTASWSLGLYSIAFLALGHIGTRKIFEKKLGGYTGDCLGAVQQISEISFLVGISVWLYSF